MLCRSIHENIYGCDQELSSDWKFCPVCGCPTGHIQIPGDQLTVDLRHNTQETKTLRLRNSGFTPVKAEIGLEPAVDQLRFVADQENRVTIMPGQLFDVKLQIPPIAAQEKSLGYLTLVCWDKYVDECGEPTSRRLRIKIVGEVESPGEVTVVEEVAIFRTDLTERDITLLNTGRAPVEVPDVNVPQGYEVTPASGVIPGAQAGIPGKLTFKVKRRWNVTDVPEDSKLVFRTGNKQEYAVMLSCPPPPNNCRLPRAIVAIDFGTASTSVAFRKRSEKNVSEKNVSEQGILDDVSFLSPFGTDTRRFPTRIHVGRDRTITCGFAATEAYKEDLTAGYLFREIKSLLRNTKDVHVYPELLADNAQEFIKGAFGENWRESLVTAYLKWLHDDLIQPEIRDRLKANNPYVLYVFSLPALDYGIDGGQFYTRQQEAMERCIRDAGFPMENVHFAFEPVCAALALLHPKDSSWPKLNTPDYPVLPDTSMVVFDSGGGTTDVVLTRVEVDNENNLSLVVEGCLGVDNDLQTFGGEWLTAMLQENLKNPNTQIPGSLYDGDLNLECALELDPSEEYPNDLRLHDMVEQLKFKLADARESITVNHGETTLRSRLLDHIATPFLRSHAEMLLDRVFKSRNPEVRQAINYYMSVGGNSSVPAVRSWAEGFMIDRNPATGRRHLQVPEDYRQLAVAYGGVWVPDAHVRHAVPYEVRILCDGNTLYKIPKFSSQDIYSSLLNELQKVRPFGKLILRLETTINGSDYRIGMAVWHNRLNQTVSPNVIADVQNGVLTVYVKSEDQAENDQELRYVL